MKINHVYPFATLAVLIGLSFSVHTAVAAAGAPDGEGSAWKTSNTGVDNDFIFKEAIVSAIDSGDPATPKKMQSLYHDVPCGSGVVTFSFEFRFDEKMNSTMRVSLYSDEAGGYGEGDVFRSIIGYGKQPMNSYTVPLRGKNAKIDLGELPLGTWIRVSGEVDLDSGTTSGRLSSPDGETVYGRWKGRSVGVDAATVSGFAIYDVSNEPSGKLSFTNITVGGR